MSRRLVLTDAEWEQARHALVELGGVWEVDDPLHEARLGGEAGVRAYESLCAKLGVKP